MYHSSERIIKNKVGLLNLAEELGNISKACKVMGFSRETFYRYQRAVNEGGVEGLIEKSRRQPNVKNRVDEVIEVAVKEMAIEYPAYGQLRASNELRCQRQFKFDTHRQLNFDTPHLILYFLCIQIVS
jgi:molybdenum-dependent DNA-binding transcriptional regulator ModE